MGTKNGTIKKSSLKDYSRPRQNGVNAITIKDNDELIQARLTNGKAEILMASRSGRAIRFNEEIVRCIGRTGAGVRGISIDTVITSYSIHYTKLYEFQPIASCWPSTDPSWATSTTPPPCSSTR